MIIYEIQERDLSHPNHYPFVHSIKYGTAHEACQALSHYIYNKITQLKGVVVSGDEVRLNGRLVFHSRLFACGIDGYPLRGTDHEINELKDRKQYRVKTNFINDNDENFAIYQYVAGTNTLVGRSELIFFSEKEAQLYLANYYYSTLLCDDERYYHKITGETGIYKKSNNELICPDSVLEVGSIAQTLAGYIYKVEKLHD